MKTEKRLTNVPTPKISARAERFIHDRETYMTGCSWKRPSSIPQDLTQVKYEMLRRVQKDEMPIRIVAASFGVYRPAIKVHERIDPPIPGRSHW